MKGNDAAYLEALRLVWKFFPESKGFNTPVVGLDWDRCVGAMQSANYSADYSCYVCRLQTDPDLGFAQKGGLIGSDAEVYKRLLAHAAFTPSGRVVVVPDAIGCSSWCDEDNLPFVCAATSVPERLEERSCFGVTRDTLIVFESGEALLVDHDERVHWARSNINRQWMNASPSETTADKL